MPCEPWVSAAICAAWLACACGGSVAGSSRQDDRGGVGDAISDAANTVESGDDGAETLDGGFDEADAEPSDAPVDGEWSTVCPLSQPASGSYCTDSPAVCEYNEAWWSISCSTVLTCIASAWTIPQTCAGPCLPAPPPNSAQCPSNPSTITGACPDAGLECSYDDGVLCNCVTVSDGGYRWECTPGPGCPSMRPRLGGTCPPGQPACTYGPLTMYCENGVLSFCASLASELLLTGPLLVGVVMSCDMT